MQGVHSRRSSSFTRISTSSLIASPSFARDVHSPSSPVVAAFLLGWVFWSGITYACRSHFFRQLARLCFNFLPLSRSATPQAPDIEAQTSPVTEKKCRSPPSALSTVRRVSNESALAFTLNMCFAFAAFADFASLLAYEPHGDTACGMPVNHSRNRHPGDVVSFLDSVYRGMGLYGSSSSSLGWSRCPRLGTPFSPGNQLGVLLPMCRVSRWSM